MIIDMHAHYFPGEYLDRLDLRGGAHLTQHIRKNKMAALQASDIETLFRAMDAADVDMQVLSASSQLPYLGTAADSADAAHRGNEIYAGIVAQNPQRLAAFALAPLPYLDESIAELRHALDELGMVGVQAGTTVLGKSIADPHFDPFFAELNRRKAVLFLHPIGLGGAAGSPAIDASKLTWPIGAPLEDTICLLQMIRAEIPRRFPNVKIIVPHLGGFAPFLTARLDNLRGHFLEPSAPPPSAQLKFFYYDTVNAYPSALHCAWEAVGTDRLLMGTDYPFWRDEQFKLGVEYVNEAGLPSGDAQKILGTNTAHLLGLKK
jgi:predicted TIM-barrel fold metal-dependent hydrolase